MSQRTLMSSMVSQMPRKHLKIVLWAPEAFDAIEVAFLLEWRPNITRFVKQCCATMQPYPLLLMSLPLVLLLLQTLNSDAPFANRCRRFWRTRIVLQLTQLTPKARYEILWPARRNCHCPPSPSFCCSNLPIKFLGAR